MRQKAVANTGTIGSEVRSVKKLEKDFLLAWFMGMILPALILGIAVGLDSGGASRAEEESSEPETTVLEIPTLPPQMNIPVMGSDGEVTEMELETYLCGVVLAEMPADFEFEALKAQSVVARTYALRRLESGTKHPQGAVCMDPACCQGYMAAEDFLSRGGSQSGITKVTQAVLATAGEVVTYDGQLIDATYFSCSGGTTEDAVDVWGNDVPYLRSTDSPGEENAAYYTDSVSFTPEEVGQALGITLDGAPEEWFTILSDTSGGGVAEMDVCGSVFTGVQVRKLLSLRSTDFTVTASEEEVTFKTHGYGHRVGMSQYGADAMAVNGSTYAQILSHYYSGTSLIQYQSDD